MDEHSVPTLAMDEFIANQPLRSNQTPTRRTSTPQTSAHAPLFVKPIRGSGKACVPSLPAYVRPSFVAHIKLMRVRCHGTSWLHTSV